MSEREFARLEVEDGVGGPPVAVAGLADASRVHDEAVGEPAGDLLVGVAQHEHVRIVQQVGRDVSRKDVFVRRARSAVCDVQPAVEERPFEGHRGDRFALLVGQPIERPLEGRRRDGDVPAFELVEGLEAAVVIAPDRDDPVPLEQREHLARMRSVSDDVAGVDDSVDWWHVGEHRPQGGGVRVNVTDESDVHQRVKARRTHKNAVVEPHAMATILVTAAGGGIGVGAIRSIQAATDHRIVGVDIEAKAGGLYCCDAGYAVPRADDDRWAEAMAEIVRTEGVDVVIPLIDAETIRIEDVIERVPGDVSVLLARDELRHESYDKYRTSQRLREEGFRVPEIVPGDRLEAFPKSAFPAVVKPRTGQGNSLGSGVERVGSRADARATIERDVHDSADLVVEEFVDGTEYTTEVIGSAGDDLLGIVPKEAISSDPYHRVTRDAPEVRTECERIFEALEPAGVLNVQQLVSDGEIYTFEINPRFSASSSLTAAAGLNGFDRCIRDALGERVEPSGGYETDRHLFRYPESVYVSTDEIVGGIETTATEPVKADD